MTYAKLAVKHDVQHYGFNAEKLHNSTEYASPQSNGNGQIQHNTWPMQEVFNHELQCSRDKWDQSVKLNTDTIVSWGYLLEKHLICKNHPRNTGEIIKHGITSVIKRKNKYDVEKWKKKI